MEVDPRTIALLVLGGVALAQTMRLWWRSASPRRRLARRRARARRGELDAEALLRREGYRVVARQAPGSASYLIDGAPAEARVVVDLVVQRRGKRFIAEVKTGEVAPDPMHRATRRQLLEYTRAYNTHGVLLVDASRGAIYTFAAPPRVGARTSGWAWLLCGGALGFVLAMWLT